MLAATGRVFLLLQAAVVPALWLLAPLLPVYTVYIAMVVSIQSTCMCRPF